MEVHHPNLHGKKKFHEYLLEFCMLFLAVTLGFLAENLREHLSDQKKEKEYIGSFINDLKSDTADIRITSKMLFTQIHAEDSLIYYLQHYTNVDSINKKCYHYYLSSAVRIAFVTFSQNTLTQLLNTGSARLIGKQNILDSIMQYNGLIKGVELQKDYYNEEFKKSFDYSSNLFDFSYLHLHLNDDYTIKSIMKYDTAHFKLLSSDPEVLRKYVAYVIMQQNLCMSYVVQLKYAKEQATRLIALLNREYKLREKE